MALVMLGLALLVSEPRIQAFFAMVAALLTGGALWLFGLDRGITWRRDRNAARVASVIEGDPAPVILADPDGAILRANTAARHAFPLAGDQTLDAALCDMVANPQAKLREMQTRLRRGGAAVRHLPGPDGEAKISVHRTAAAQFLWRLDIGTAPCAPPGEGDDHPLPMLELGEDDAVLALNPAARDLLGPGIETLADLCQTELLRPGAPNLIETPTGPMDCLVIEREGRAGRRVIYIVPHAQAPGGDTAWAFFEDLPVPLLKLGRDGMIRRSNAPARDLLGLASTTDTEFAETLEGLGRSIKEWIDDAASKRGTVHAEFLRVRRDDREVFVQVTLNRAVEKGEIVLVAVMNDATELKSLEAQFVQSQKMQAIGQLAGGVAHDFNNLLTAITGHCDLLLLRHDHGDPDYADLMQINQNANRAAALVRQLLAYSRKQTLRPQLIDLRETLADLTHLLNRLVGEKVSLDLSHDPALSVVRADKRQLEQVIMNLVVNARDAMPDGGDIRIETENLTLTRPWRRDRAVVAPGRYVSVRITDEGVGIPPDKAQKVFDPFFTTKRAGEGTGLGLSTAYGIVKQTGGFIFLDSAPQQGTVFRLLFPAHRGPGACASVPPRETAPTGPASGVVLLVEDEAPVRAFARRALQLRGYTVLEAGSAEAALEVLSDPALHVDVFVTDVVMPGLDGPTWVQMALELRPETRVIFMSGYAAETFSDVQVSIPRSAFLQKPFSLRELTETVQRETG